MAVVGRACAGAPARRKASSVSASTRAPSCCWCVLGPGDLPVQRAAYLRSLDDYGAVYTRSVRFPVDAFLPDASETPDGYRMRLPPPLPLVCQTDRDEPLLWLECTVQGDYHYGLGAGYSSWLRFDGHCQGRAVSGQGYLAFINRR